MRHLLEKKTPLKWKLMRLRKTLTIKSKLEWLWLWIRTRKRTLKSHPLFCQRAPWMTHVPTLTQILQPNQKSNYHKFLSTPMLLSLKPNLVSLLKKIQPTQTQFWIPMSPLTRWLLLKLPTNGKRWSCPRPTSKNRNEEIIDKRGIKL